MRKTVLAFSFLFGVFFTLSSTSDANAQCTHLGNTVNCPVGVANGTTSSSFINNNTQILWGDGTITNTPCCPDFFGTNSAGGIFDLNNISGPGLVSPIQPRISVPGDLGPSDFDLWSGGDFDDGVFPVSNGAPPQDINNIVPRISSTYPIGPEQSSRPVKSGVTRFTSGPSTSRQPSGAGTSSPPIQTPGVANPYDPSPIGHISQQDHAAGTWMDPNSPNYRPVVAGLNPVAVNQETTAVKRQINIDDMISSQNQSFPASDIVLGYMIAVTEGSHENVALSSVIANPPSGLNDLAVFVFEPQPIETPPGSAAPSTTTQTTTRQQVPLAFDNPNVDQLPLAAIGLLSDEGLHFLYHESFRKTSRGGQLFRAIGEAYDTDLPRAEQEANSRAALEAFDQALGQYTEGLIGINLVDSHNARNESPVNSGVQQTDNKIIIKNHDSVMDDLPSIIVIN